MQQKSSNPNTASSVAKKSRKKASQFKERSEFDGDKDDEEILHQNDESD